MTPGQHTQLGCPRTARERQDSWEYDTSIFEGQNLHRNAPCFSMRPNPKYVQHYHSSYAWPWMGIVIHDEVGINMSPPDFLAPGSDTDTTSDSVKFSVVNDANGSADSREVLPEGRRVEFLEANRRTGEWSQRLPTNLTDSEAQVLIYRSILFRGWRTFSAALISSRW